MRLKDIEINPLSSFDYLERIVNNGSKSGFTDIHNTSSRTNPFFSEGFFVKKFITSEKYIKCYGEPKQNHSLFNAKDFIFIHPDWEYTEYSKILFSFGKVEESIWVIPTSSSRTVRIQGTHSYLKLHYPGMIGRLDRKLGFQQLMSSLTINAILDQGKLNNRYPEVFDFMTESCGRLLIKDDIEIGFILREIPQSLMNNYLIPAFSLFSVDRKRPNEDLLLHQILDKQANAYEFFLNKICFSLLDIFFTCAFNEGLIPEMHSQNIIFAFNTDWSIRKIILRDFESIDKDLSIRQDIGKNIDFSEYPYKCISSSDENYLKRHSLMFDHKLCEYLIDPLVECAALYLRVETTVMQQAIRDYLHSKYGVQLSAFFPTDNCWYKYPDKEIDRATDARPYTSMGYAIYR